MKAPRTVRTRGPGAARRIAAWGMAVLLHGPLGGLAQSLPVYRLPHTVSPEPGLQLRVEEQGQRWLVRWPDGRQQPLGEALGRDERQRSAVLIQADYNFDGHADLAMVDGVGYAGAYATYRLFLWHPASHAFRAFPTVIGEPELQPARQALIDWQRDGPRMSSTEYRARQGELVRYVTREPVLGHTDLALDLLTFYPPDAPKVTDSRIIDAATGSDADPQAVPAARARITVAKAWLHQQPQARARTRMYLIKGDLVQLLGHQGPKGERDERDEPDGWLFVRYDGRKPVELWIPARTIVP